MAVRLFVGNLPYDVTEAEVRTHFAAVGPLSFLALPMDRTTGKPRGFAFVEFRDQADAEEALRRFNNQEFKGRPLAVHEARARDDHATPESSSPLCTSTTGRRRNESRRQPEFRPRRGPAAPPQAVEGYGESRACTEATHVQTRRRTCALQC